MHMSYGKYVSIGCPNLQRFKRRVENGDFDRKPERKKRIKLKKDGVSPANRKIETTIICKQCGDSFTYIRFGGPVKEYCPECRANRCRESSRESWKRLRKKKRGESENDVL